MSILSDRSHDGGRNGSWPSDPAVYEARLAVVVGPADAFEIDVDALNLRTEGAVEPRRKQGATVRQVQATIVGVLLVCFSIVCSTSDSIDDVSPSVDAGPVTPSDSGWFEGVEWAADASRTAKCASSCHPSRPTGPCRTPAGNRRSSTPGSEHRLGALRSSEGEDSIATLLIAGYDTEVQEVTQEGEAVPWMQQGRGLVVVTPFNVNGALRSRSPSCRAARPRSVRSGRQKWRAWRGSAAAG